MDRSHGRLRRASSDEYGEQQWLRNIQSTEGRRISVAEQSTGGVTFGSSRAAGDDAGSRRSSVATGPGSSQETTKPPQQKSNSQAKDSGDSYPVRQAQNQFTFPTYSSNTSRGSSTKTSSSSLQALNENTAIDSRCCNPSKGSNTSTITEGVVHSTHSSPRSSESIARSGLHVNTGSDFPVYPDQSYAVLQSQVYPAPYQPHSLRTRGSRPSHHSLHSDFALPSRISKGPTPPTQVSRTAGNTPVSSPGLFSGRNQTATTPWGLEDGFHPPYLHPTHLQAPKETHTVEVDRDMQTGNKLINEYEILDELGRGQHGKVKLGRHLKTGQKVAIKIVQRYSKRRRLGKLGNPEDKVKKEVAILKKARHPNVVSLLEVIDDPNLQKVYIVLEYVENGEISWRTKGPREIVEVDKRRLEREKRGIPDSPSFMEESENYVRHVQLRRQQRDRRRQITSDSPHDIVPAWSLEHGGQSDDELDPELALCRTHSSLATTLAQENTDIHGSPSAHSLASVELDKRVRDSYLAAVEGSMYGAYAPETTSERRFSTASSNFGYAPSEPDWYRNDDDISYVPCLTISEARNAFRDSVLGLEYLHYQGIIHRDIKPANLLVTSSGRVKISDFGVSYLGRPIRDGEEEMVGETDATELDDARELSKTVGTPAFYAPELCYTDSDFEVSIGTVPKITGAIDVWSLGVTLYGMIFGRLPFVSEDEFSMFQTIVKSDAFIPRKRLKAVELSNSSHVHPPHIMNSNKRLWDELEYEYINDDLYDLLRRLLIKDPSKRITLKEIKYHPWVLSGLQNPRAWIEETDPSYQSKGKRIEVSNEEVTSAVTKIPFIERVRSNVARWGNIFTRSGHGRKRAPSAAAASTDTLRSSSTSSSNSTVGRDAMREIRRPSLRPDEETSRIPPKPSRDGDHPLSQSVTASPEAKPDRFSYFGPVSRTEPSSSGATPQAEEPALRPDPPERTVSGAESAKTVRPLTADTTPSSPPRAPTPTLIESLGSSSISGIFGGAGRRLAKSAKSLQSGEWRGRRSRSTDRLSESDAHCGPTLAVNTTSVEGQMQAPDSLRDQSLSSSVRSEGYSHPTLAGPRHWRSRSHHLVTESESFQPSRQVVLRSKRSSQEPMADTKYATFRQESEIPSNDFHLSDGGPCSQKVTEWSQNPVVQAEPVQFPSGGSPPSATTISSTALSSSSVDDFSGMSQSASHPSIPSVLSGASSLSADGFHPYVKDWKKDDTVNEVPAMMRTGETVTIRDKRKPQDEVEESKYYSGDDEDEDDSDFDEGIVFGKKPVTPKLTNDDQGTI